MAIPYKNKLLYNRYISFPYIRHFARRTHKWSLHFFLIYHFHWSVGSVICLHLVLHFLNPHWPSRNKCLLSSYFSLCPICNCFHRILLVSLMLVSQHIYLKCSIQFLSLFLWIQCNSAWRYMVSLKLRAIKLCILLCFILRGTCA